MELKRASYLPPARQLAEVHRAIFEASAPIHKALATVIGMNVPDMTMLVENGIMVIKTTYSPETEEMIQMANVTLQALTEEALRYYGFKDSQTS